MAVQIQIRRGTAAEGLSVNPILAEGELGYEKDTGKFKIGNGTSTYSALGYIFDAPMGIQWNQSTDTYVRTGNLAGKTLAVGDAFLPIHSRIRGCVMLDSGAVSYYLKSTDWAYKEDGTSSVLTGADGQVMVEIPKFYYKYTGSSDIHNWSISSSPLSGYSVHPAFIKNGVEVENRYIAAYEGVLYDTSGAAYTNGNSGQTKDFTASTGDKLSSVSGKLAVTNGTRAQFRTIAFNRGTGWRQLDCDLVHAIEVLFLIEYGSFYSQSVFGSGISNVADWNAYNNYYPIVPSGMGNGIGNATGQNAAADSATAATVAASGYSKYRGIENFFGHIWKFVDGININSNVPYISNNSLSWTDDTVVNYTPIGVTLAATTEYQKTLVYSSRVMLPATVGGGADSSHYITDYYWIGTGWRVAVFGGTSSSGSNCGFWYWYLSYGSGDSDSNIGARLAF